MMNTISPMWIPIFGIMMPVVLVPVILGMKHARLDRELEHAERMKALELGRTLPQDEPWWSPARICVAIGAGVPVGVFLVAWLATTSAGYHEEIWTAASYVGFPAVIAGSLLAAKHFSRRDSAPFATKPPVDADAFDVVGSRG